MAGGVTGGGEDRDAICDLLVTPDCVTLIAWSKRPCGIGVEAICFNGVDLGCLRVEGRCSAEKDRVLPAVVLRPLTRALPAPGIAPNAA